MLTFDQIDVLANPILELFQEFEDSVLADIARRLVKLDFSSTAAWQAQRLLEAGAIYENIIAQLALLTGRSESELKRTFERAGVRSLRFDDSIYREAGLDPLPLNLSPQMAQVLIAGLQRTAGLMRNLTATTALSGQQSFIAAADLAWLQVSSGTFSYDEAIRAAVKSVGMSGMEIFYPSGQVDKLDVAMRRAVLTGVGKTAGELQWSRADEMGQDLVQVSEHIGARPSHQVWQGGIYSRSGRHPRYPDFVSSTGYGTGPGLGGWNCRHSFYPFFEGISKNAYDRATRGNEMSRTVSYGDRKLTMYEASQVQRKIERKIREWKRQAQALEAAKLEATRELAKVKEWQASMRSFLRQTGLQRQYVREQI